MQGPAPESEPRYLSTAGEAGYWAVLARAKRLLLTHFWPGSDRDISASEAREVFDGEVIVAEEGLHVDLSIG